MGPVRKAENNMFNKIWGRIRDTFKPVQKPPRIISESGIQPKIPQLPQRVIRNLQIQMAMKAFAGLSQQQAYELVRKRLKKRHSRKAKGKVKL